MTNFFLGSKGSFSVGYKGVKWRPPLFRVDRVSGQEECQDLDFGKRTDGTPKSVLSESSFTLNGSRTACQSALRVTRPS